MSTSLITKRHPSNELRCLIVTYTGINLSDDLICCGVENILKKAFRNQVSFIHVSRASAFSYTGLSFLSAFSSIRGINRIMSQRLLHKVLKYGSSFRKVDLVVIAGTPWFYSDKEGRYSIGKQKNAQILIREYLQASKNAGIPVMCLGLGNSFSLGESEAVLYDDTESMELLRILIDGTRIVHVRDKLAARCVDRLGFQFEELVCPSVFARLSIPSVSAKPPPSRVGIILSSYILELHDSVKVALFHSQLAACARENISSDQLMLIAHNGDDKRLSERLFPGVEVVLANSTKSYLSLLRDQCLAVISTRVHAAMVAHSFGIPVMLFKIDERAVIATKAGIKTLDYTDMNPFLVESFLSDVKSNDTRAIPDYEPDLGRYCNALRTALNLKISDI